MSVEPLLTDVAERLGEFSVQVTGQIRAEVPGYAKLPYPSHLQDVETQLRSVIDGLRHRRPPPAAVIDNAREVGRRRAAYHLELPDVIEAYHIAYRELWNELLSNAADPAVLVAEVGFIWNWFHRLSAAVAASHAEETHNRVTTRIVLRRRLVESLAGRHVSQEEQGELARALGFDPAGEFAVACVAGLPETRVEQLNATLSGVAHCVYEAGRVVIVAQGGADLVAAVHGTEPDALVGVGLPRVGLAGAASSLADASDALVRARVVGRDVCFADDWLMVLLTTARDRIGPLLAAGAEVAARHPQLARTVRAFVDGKYSVSACARLLHVHPNSARYRLDRWRELTGWDVHRFPDLAASLACLEL